MSPMKNIPPPSARLWLICLSTLALGFAGYLVTGAEPKAPPATANPPSADAQRDREHARAERNFVLLQNEFERIQEEVQKKWQELNKLREHLELTDRETDENASNSPAVDAIRILETQILETTMKRREQDSLYQELHQMPSSDLKGALPTAAPDPALTSLLQNEAAAEQKLVALSAILGEENPEVRAAQKVLGTIKKEIDARQEGILRGMKVRIAASQATLEQLHKELQRTKRASIERAITIGPYFLVKRDLENLQQMRDRLHLKLIQDRLDLALLQAR